MLIFFYGAASWPASGHDNQQLSNSHTASYSTQPLGAALDDSYSNFPVPKLTHVFNQVPSWAVFDNNNHLLQPFIPNETLTLDLDPAPERSYTAPAQPEIRIEPHTPVSNRSYALNSYTSTSFGSYKQFPALSESLGDLRNLPQPEHTSDRSLRAPSMEPLPGGFEHATGLSRAHTPGLPLDYDTLHMSIIHHLGPDLLPPPLQSPAPSRVSSSHLPTSDTPIKLSQKQGYFSWEQVLFINVMRRRWKWFLISEDLFPISTTCPQELTTSYAERILNGDRTEHKIGKQVFDYVSALYSSRLSYR